MRNRKTIAAARGKLAPRQLARPIEWLEPRTLLSAGDLDPSFGAGGTVVTEFTHGSTNLSSGSGAAVAVQADGRLIVAGEVAGGELAVARYLPDGTPDPGFGRGGITLIDFGARDDWGTAVALAPGGKIVVAGTSGDSIGGVGQAAVARLNADGTLDRTFDGDGRQVFDPAGGRHSVNAVLVGADGRVLLAGGYDPTGNTQDAYRFWLARLDASGAPDPTFGGGDGVVQTPVGLAGAHVNAAALDGEGRIVAAGVARAHDPAQFPSRPWSFAVARYLPDGTPDPSFGGGAGSVLTSFGPLSATAQDVGTDASGRIVAAGRRNGGVAPAPTDGDFAAARYLPDGGLDPSFGAAGDGRVTVNFRDGSPPGVMPIIAPSNDAASAAVVEPDGSIVLAGGTIGGVGAPAGGARVALARLCPDGSLDPTFGPASDGLAIGGPGAATALVADATGRLVATAAGVPNVWPVFVVDRYTPAGAPDLPFGTTGDGRVVSYFTRPLSGRAEGVAVQPDGKVLVPAFVEIGGGSFRRSGALYRYNADGSPDLTVGPGGRLAVDFPGEDDSVAAVAVQPDGRIVVAGTTTMPGTGRDFAAARYLPDGSPDPTFGPSGTGTVTVALGPANDSDDSVGAMSLYPDGRVLLTGFATNYQFAMARLDASGRPDPSFGTNGWSVPAGGRAGNLALGPDGSIYTASAVYFDYIPATSFRITRYDPAGRLDAGYSAGGGLTDAGNALGIAVGPDGSVFIGGAVRGRGSAQPATGYDFALLRFAPDGRQDTWFGGGPGMNGVARVDFFGADDDIEALYIQRDGSVLVAGTADARDGSPPRFALARFTPTGQIDPTFGRGTGKVTNAIGDVSASPVAIARAPGAGVVDDKVVVAGTTRAAGGSEGLALARYDATVIATVRDRRTFYNVSAYDGYDPAPNAADDGAVAANKQALRPGGYASFVNLTTTPRGLNGVMIDVRGLPDAPGRVLSADDFTFRAGRTKDPAAWAEAPAPSAIAVRRGAGAGHSDRVMLTWPNGALTNTWLQVTVNATPDTGLAAPDVFYFGNLMGETGDIISNGSWRVTSADFARARMNVFRRVGPESLFDFDRSGIISGLDLMTVRRNLDQSLPTFAAPAAAAAGVPTPAPFADRRIAAPPPAVAPDEEPRERLITAVVN